MKYVLLLTLSFLTILINAQCVAQCTEIVQNGSFTSGWSNWSKESGWGISTYAGQTTAATNTVDNSPAAGYSITQSLSGLAGATTLQLKFDAYPQSPNTGTSYIDVFLGSTRYARLTNANGSSQATVTVYSPATCVSCASWNMSTWKTGIAINIPWSPVVSSSSLKFTFISASSLRDWAVDNISLISQLTPTASSTVTNNGACQGSAITFNTSATNVGTPTYQWKRNGNNVGTNSATYSSSALSNGDIISCVVTPSLTCVTSPTVTTNSITTIVVQKVTPSVFISGNPSVDRKNPSTFTANPTNGGASPTYQWYKNGALKGSGPSFTDTAWYKGTDTIRLRMTTSLSCVTVDTAVSTFQLTVLSLKDVKYYLRLDSVYMVFTKEPDDVVYIYSFDEKTGKSEPLLVTTDKACAIQHTSRYYAIVSPGYRKIIGPFPLVSDDPKKNVISTKQLLGQYTN